MSLWGKYLTEKKFEKLNKDIRVNTLIIGGGITGLTTLYYLKEKESVCLVDASFIGEGVTKNTTGKLTYLQEDIYSNLEKNRNTEIAVQYLHSQKQAISLIKEIIEKEKIDCDLERVDSYIFASQEKDVKKIEAENNFLKRQKINVKEKILPFSVPSFKAICVEDTYVFNPIKYLNGLKDIIKTKMIYEQTKIKKIEYKNKQYTCYANDKKIIANQVIVACHYPFFLFPFLLPLKSHIEKSYLIATKTDKYKKASCINVSNPSISMRYYKDGNQVYQIFLTNSHNTAVKQNDKTNFENVKQFFGLKEEEIVAKWSNVDIITDDKLPYIGELKDNLYIATGLNTWGMTNGILSAKILSDAIKGIDNPYQELFKIYRSNRYQWKSLLPNVITSTIAFVGSKFQKKKWYSNNLMFKKANGKNIAIYKDEHKKEHIVYTTCPHFGCSLIFNEEEKTWDCPCHSSRFNLDGKCIKGPSLYDISYKK